MVILSAAGNWTRFSFLKTLLNCVWVCPYRIVKEFQSRQGRLWVVGQTETENSVSEMGNVFVFLLFISGKVQNIWKTGHYKRSLWALVTWAIVICKY